MGIRQYKYVRISWLSRMAILGIFLLWAGESVWGAEITLIREPLENNLYATLNRGRVLSLECRFPQNSKPMKLLKRYTISPHVFKSTKPDTILYVPYNYLKPDMQRMVFAGMFKEDHADADGWWHVIRFAGEGGTETVWSVCEWLTGKGTNETPVRTDSHNQSLPAGPLQKGQTIFIPKAMLLPVFSISCQTPMASTSTPAPSSSPSASPPVANPSPDNASAKQGKAESEQASSANVDAPPELKSDELKYGSDKQGAYAEYRLKQGEALYTAVVVRFTDISGHTNIMSSCDAIQKRSGIKDVHGMRCGQRILIPLDMLSDRYKPESSSDRKEYESVIQEAKRLKQDGVRSKELQGVVVVLDAGHGGRDHGVQRDEMGLYEHRINYDIACRIKAILEKSTQAKVYMTIRDKVQGYTPTNSKRFSAANAEELLTTPTYDNSHDAKISANLRWCLANSIFQQEQQKGTDSRKIVFTSIHTDSLFDGRLRGTMIYVPGARYRNKQERFSDPLYTKFKEFRDQRKVQTTADERKRDEALSRNFGEIILDKLKSHRPPVTVHSTGDPIRAQIRQEGGVVYVPAVLRNNKIPTKILIETANIINSQDAKALADPAWRNAFAEAYVEALKAYFGA